MPMSVSCSQRRWALAPHGFGATAKLKETSSPGTGSSGCGCQFLAGWILWSSGYCLSPGGREAGPLHYRHIPGEGMHHPLLCPGAQGWAWAHHIWCHIWKKPGQPHCQPPACLGLRKSVERGKVSIGLVLSCQTPDVMWGWAVCAATTTRRKGERKKREQRMVDIYGSRTQREGILREG